MSAPEAGPPPAGPPRADVPLDGEPRAGAPLDGEPLAGAPLDGEPRAGAPLDGEPRAGAPLDGEPRVVAPVGPLGDPGALPPVRLKAPLDGVDLGELVAGREVLITGTILAARDQAHKRLVGLLAEGLSPPVDLGGQAVYYVGPSPPRPGRPAGSAGPTTSGRMDHLTVPLLSRGVKALLGKGRRSPEVVEATRAAGAVYLAALGGAGALYGQRILEVKVLAWPELGPEALMALRVADFPAIVVNDLHGGDLYESGPAFWRSAAHGEG